MCFPRSAQATILVHPLPTINPGPTVVVAYNAPFTLKPTYGPDIVSYNWNPISQLNCSGCASPSGIALASIKYTVTATTSKGCIASDTLQLRLECKEENLLTPNAFTPNGDNLNDYFYPIARGLDLINKFVIYNRYGQIIFERNNFKPNDKMAGWNGNYNGKAQPSGSYQYVIQAVCDLGNAINKTGTVVLIK
jgi:gliding motility-associated-like protein